MRWFIKLLMRIRYMATSYNYNLAKAGGCTTLLYGAYNLIDNYVATAPIWSAHYK